MDLLDWIAGACVLACSLAGLWALWAVNSALDDWDDAPPVPRSAAAEEADPGSEAADLAIAAAP